MNVMTSIATRKQKGFTLIELVMVIVILGLLAAFALPRFADLGGDARAATMQGVYGAARSANSIVRSACLADGDCDQTAASGESVTLEGATINLAYGYPTAASIVTAAQVDGGDFTVTTDSTATPPTTTIAANASGSCQVTYAEATGAADAPDIAVTDSGC